MYGASRLTPEQAPPLWRLAATLGERAGLANQPELYYLPSQMLNAFAVGSKTNAAIGVTDGLLRQLDQRELTAVLAHEISHIRSNDLWVMGLADLFSRATSLLSLVRHRAADLRAPSQRPGAAGPVAHPRVRCRPQCRASDRRPGWVGPCPG